MGRSGNSIERFLASAASQTAELGSVLAQHKAKLLKDAAGIKLGDILATLEGLEPEEVRADMYIEYRMGEHLFVGLCEDLLILDYFFSANDIQDLLSAHCSRVGDSGRDDGYRFELRQYTGRRVAAFHHAVWSRYGDGTGAED